MGANFSGGGATVFHDRTDTPGEITTSLINSTDGQGLHFDGAAGNIDIASPPDLGTKLSFEFVIQADSFGSTNQYFIDFGNGGRFLLGSLSSVDSYNLAIFSATDWVSFGVKVLDDLKVHHLTLTVDGTAAILYDNGNQVGTATIVSPNIDLCTDARIGSHNEGTSEFVNGTIYRARFWNKTLSQAEVTASYENATVPFSDQYGNATVLNTGSVPAGLRWRIIEHNTVNFVTYGAANNSIGTEFVTTTAIPALNANDRLQQIGCVADYDLAFANPTQSDQVQDRSTNLVDGTASAGVTQVTKIEAVNTNKLNVGGTTPLVGIGLAAGVTPAATLHVNTTVTGGALIDASGQTGTTARLELKADRPSADQDSCDIRFYNNNAAPIAHITAVKGSGANDTDGKLDFYTSNAKRLTIDSAGLATFSNGITVSAGTANFAGSYLNVGGGYGATGLSISDAGVLQADGLATFSSGIVETNGVLKSNLLSNSGFDVWSNSTLVDVGSDLAVDGTFSDTEQWGEQAGWEVTGGKAVADAAAGAAQLWQDRTYTLGKLYRAVFEISGHSLGGVTANFGGAVSETFAGDGTHTFVFEATSTSSYINFVTVGTTTLDIEYVTLYEVTPGCVAADALAFDGWKKDSANLTLERYHWDGGSAGAVGDSKDGSFYTAKMVSTAAKVMYWDTMTGTDLDWVARWKGRTVTLGAWVKSSVAAKGSLTVYTNGGSSTSTNTGTGWEWIETTFAIATSATTVLFWIKSDTATTFVSQPMLVFGNAIGAGNYSRPMGEIVNCEKHLTLQGGATPLASDDKTLNLEAMSNGMIPKGCKAISTRAQLINDSVTAGQGISWGADSTNSQSLAIYPLINGRYQSGNGVVPCDSNGDIYQYVNEADNTLGYLYQYVDAVHLR